LALQIQHLIRKHDTNIVLDVGGFKGSFCKKMRHDAKFDGHISSFEPCAESFEVLSRAMADDKRWSGYRVGLSNWRTSA
jgi:hypothetical protein